MQETPSLIRLVAIYARVALENQAELAEQRSACLSRARELVTAEEHRTGQRLRLEVVEFWDFGSGLLLERPGLRRFRDFVRNHRPHYVISVNPERLSRKMDDVFLIVDEIEATGTESVFVDGSFNPSFLLRMARKWAKS